MIPNFKTDLALSRVINQLFEAPNYTEIIRAIAATYDDQDEVLTYIGTLSIETARGVWLDLIGSIIGQGRRVPIDLTYQYFGFTDIDPNLGGFGSIFFYETAPEETSNLLGDEEYRAVLYAVAAKNAGDVSLVGIVETLGLVFDSESVFAYNAGNASLNIMIEGEVSQNLIELTRAGIIVPKAAGVKLRSFFNYDADAVFGFADIDPTVEGFGVGKFPQELL